MKPLLLPLYSFVVLISAAVISPLVFLNTTEDLNTVADRPIIESPDLRFKIEVSFDGPKLPLISCLINIVDFLVILGLHDFSESMEKVSWKLDDYPEVGMVVSPRMEGGRIERRFIIWGLGQGAALMIRLIRFQAVTFTLLWEGEEVGTIELVSWPTTQHTRRGSHIGWFQNPTQQSNLSTIQGLWSPSQNINMKAENLQGPQLVVRIALIESAVPLFDVFLMTIGVLVDTASMGATKQLQDYTSLATAGGVDIIFKSPVPARTSPPFFQVQWLMKTMATIPHYMIRKGAFKQALVLVEVDGVKVADGFLGFKEAGVGLMKVNSNMSVL